MALTALSLVLGLSACGSATSSSTTTTAPENVDPASAQPALEPENGRLPADVAPQSYEVDLSIDPDQDAYSGVVRIQTAIESPHRRIFMHGVDLRVRSAVIHTAGGRSIEATWEGSTDDDSFATLTTAEPVSGLVQIEIAFETDLGTALGGIYKVESGGDAYAFTQMEPLDARHAFPCFDEPRFKVPFDVTIRSRPEHVALANSSLEGETEENGQKVSTFVTTAPMPTYLFALAVGPLEVVEGEIPPNEIRDHALPFRGVAPRGRGEELAYTMEHTPAILASLENWFGSPYPFDKLDVVAVPDFGAGAMENIGLVTFRDSILLVDEARTPTRRMRFWAYIMAHELAHMWFGNLVTMEWWDDLWLNEAFASWIEHTAVANWRPDYEADVSLAGWVHYVMGEDSLAGARAIRQPIESSHDILNAFDGITYGKGAGVLAMFERFVGPETFQQGIRAYLTEHAGGNATGEDLFRALSEAAGRDIGGPMRSIVEHVGLPMIRATLTCEEGSATVQLAQSRYAPLGSRAERDVRYSVPVCVRYGMESGEGGEVCEIVNGEGSVSIEGGCPQWIHPNAAGAGYYRWSLEAEQLAALREHGLDSLTVTERLSLVSSMRAAFEAGEIEGGVVMDAMLALAADPHHAVARALVGFFTEVLENVVDEEHRAPLRRRLLSAYALRTRALGWTRGRQDDEATRILRGVLGSFVALELEDGRFVRDGRRFGDRYLGRTELDPDAIATDLAQAGAILAVQGGGTPAFEKALARLDETPDATARRNLIIALASVEDEALGQRALALTMDDRLRVNEMLLPIRVRLGNEETREAAWAYLQENFAQLAERLPPSYAGSLPEFTTSFCSAEGRAEVEGFFQERVEELPGGPRNLSLSLEAIELCAARVEGQRASVHAWLEQ